jgi:hypothetical protein
MLQTPKSINCQSFGRLHQSCVSGCLFPLPRLRAGLSNEDTPKLLSRPENGSYFLNRSEVAWLESALTYELCWPHVDLHSYVNRVRDAGKQAHWLEALESPVRELGPKRSCLTRNWWWALLDWLIQSSSLPWDLSGFVSYPESHESSSIGRTGFRRKDRLARCWPLLLQIIQSRSIRWCSRG